MFTEATQKLFFAIELIDRVTAPSRAVTGALQQIQAQFRNGVTDIAQGGSGLLTAGAGLLKITEATRGLNKALGEVESLDVPLNELDKLAARSKDFVADYGGNVAEIVRSGYDIQSAIPGLAKGALAEFTYQGNLLAKAGKANADTMTKYQGTMYNIFEKDANRIGQAKWVEQLTGKTAHAIKIFKTTGNDMAAAFSNLGSLGQVSGISMDEQLGVLGLLQGSMGGANAGTAYKAFLNKVGTAQKALGMQFTDSTGKMLPMVDILEKIRKQVGPGQLKIADQVRLMQAFGDEGGKAVMNLLDKTENLKGAIADISKITDSSNAAKMARSMTDELERFYGIWNVFKTSVFQSLLPIVNSGLTGVSAVLMGIVRLTDAFPPLRWGIASVVMALASLFAVFGMIKLVSGCISIFNTLQATYHLLAAQIKAATAAQRIHVVWTRIAAAAVWVWNTALNAGVSAMLFSGVALARLSMGQRIATISSWLMSGGLWSAATAAWGFAAALWATGIPEIVLAIAALVAGVVLVYRNFDKLNSILPGLGDGLLMMLGPIGWIAELIKNWNDLPGIFTRMGQGIRTVYDWIAGKLCAAFRWVSGLLSGFWNGFKKMCPNIANLLEKLFFLWWEGAKGAFRFWRDTFTGIYQFTAGIVKAIGGFFTWLWRSITEPLSAVWAKLSGIGDFFAGIAGRIAGAFSSVFSAVSGIGGAVADTVTGIFSSVDGWIGGILRKVSKIPGLGFLNPDVTAGTGTQEINKVIKTAGETDGTAAPVVQNIIADHGTDSAFSDVIAARRRNDSDIPAGGVRSSSKVNHWGGVNIFAPNGMGPGQLEEWALLQG